MGMYQIETIIESTYGKERLQEIKEIIENGVLGRLRERVSADMDSLEMSQ